MIKKIIFNTIILFAAYFVPLYFMGLYEYSVIITKSIQNNVHFAILLGSILIIYLNNKYRKQEIHHKWVWVMFEIIGILGLLYSGFVLLLIFLLKDCCGF